MMETSCATGLSLIGLPVGKRKFVVIALSLVNKSGSLRDPLRLVFGEQLGLSAFDPKRTSAVLSTGQPFGFVRTSRHEHSSADWKSKSGFH